MLVQAEAELSGPVKQGQAGGHPPSVVPVAVRLGVLLQTGSSMGGTWVNTGRTCKLHTERPGNKPRHVARCGT